jgi:hypothetical protein
MRIALTGDNLSLTVAGEATSAPITHADASGAVFTHGSDGDYSYLRAAAETCW